jgi:hypothetical protein
MATLTDEQRKNLLAQIQAAQQQISVLQTQRGSFAPAPTGQVLGASTTGLNAAQMGGASGLGFEDQAAQTAISGATQHASEQGRARSETGNAAPGAMSREQAEFALRGAGLGGIVDAGKFAGMNPAEAQRQIQAERQKRMGQTSQLTSFAFNPEAMASTKRLVDRLNFTLTDVNNDPFKSKASKSEQIQSILKGSSREIGALFNTPEEFQQALASNPALQQTMQTFQALGGSPDDVTANIVPKSTQPTDTMGYLDSLYNPQANQQAVDMAMDEMFPERMIAQQEIARQAQIPREMMDLYFGTEDQVGVLEMKKSQAEEQKRIIERQEKDEKLAVERRARLTIDKNNAEAQIQIAKIEENRLAAKNYMTGMLAKLGALNTTGAAPQALQTLETKYQMATQQMEMQYKYANKEIELKLDEALNELVTDRDTRILRVEQDLTKDYEDIMKEVMKLEQSSEKEIYRITEQYARRLRERTTSYTKDLQKEAEKYAKSFAKTAGGGLDLFSLSESVGGTLSRASNKNAITSSITTVKNDIRKNLAPDVSNRIINDLTDEQLRLFLDDFLNERVNRQQSFDASAYFEDWKQNLGIKQPKEKAEAGLPSWIDDL